MRKKILNLLILLIFIANYPFFPIHAESAATLNELKVAYVHNFLRLSKMEIPNNDVIDNQNYELCVTGEEELVNLFKVLNKRKVSDRVINVRRIKTYSDIKNCTSIFISQNATRIIEKNISRIISSSKLLIFDINTHQDHSGHISLVKKESGLSFIINISTAEKSNISFSSQLLKLAKEIIDEKY